MPRRKPILLNPLLRRPNPMRRSLRNPMRPHRRNPFLRPNPMDDDEIFDAVGITEADFVPDYEYQQIQYQWVPISELESNPPRRRRRKTKKKATKRKKTTTRKAGSKRKVAKRKTKKKTTKRRTKKTVSRRKR